MCNNSCQMSIPTFCEDFDGAKLGEYQTLDSFWMSMHRKLGVECLPKRVGGGRRGLSNLLEYIHNTAYLLFTQFQMWTFPHPPQSLKSSSILGLKWHQFCGESNEFFHGRMWNPNALAHWLQARNSQKNNGSPVFCKEVKKWEISSLCISVLQLTLQLHAYKITHTPYKKIKYKTT